MASICNIEKHSYNVFDYGAKGDGLISDTIAIQTAIDTCSSGGGGTVLLLPGKYLIGTIRLKSNVDLHLLPGAELLGSTNLEEYASDIQGCGFVNETHIDKALIYAENVSNISITGKGTIDGQGAAFRGNAEGSTGGERPMLIRCFGSEKILVDGVTLKNAGSWCVHMRECFDVRVTGVTINSRVCWNNDGIDLMSTSRVRISDCTIICLDDAICFQNMTDDKPVEDIVITNCIMSTRWAAIRSGGANAGGIRNITVSNCVIRDTYGCAIKLQISSNGSMENILFSNIVMQNVSCPISLRFGNCHYNNDTRDTSRPWGSMRNITFSNIWASVVDEATLRDKVKFPALFPGEERQCVSICGIPSHPIENIGLNNIHFIFPGGGTREDAANLNPPEREDDYPEYFMWGVLPAYGLFCRHARNLSLNNIRFDLGDRDLRPAIVCDDVHDMDIDILRVSIDPEADCVTRLLNTHSVNITQCRITGGQVPLICESET